MDNKNDNPTDFIRSEITVRSHDSNDEDPILIGSGSGTGGRSTTQSRSFVVSFDRRLNPNANAGSRVGGIVMSTGSTSRIKSGTGEEMGEDGVENTRGIKRESERISENQNSQSKYDQNLLKENDNTQRKVSLTDLMNGDHIHTLNRNLSSKVVSGPKYENLGLRGSYLFDKENVAVSGKIKEIVKSKSKCLIPFDILVVDDSKLNRKMLCKVLRSEGHSCDEAEDGIHAVQKVRMKMNTSISKSKLMSIDDISMDSDNTKNDDDRVVEKPYFDAILMDFVMPNMDGPTGQIFVTFSLCFTSFSNCSGY